MISIRKTTRLTALLAIGIFITANCQAQSFLTNGLIAWYKFNGNATDSSGNGNDGTVVGATLTTDRFNNSNSAYTFNGNSTAVDLTPTNFNNLTSGTILAWVKLNENTQDVIFAKQDDGVNSMGVFTVGFSININGSFTPSQGQLAFKARNGASPITSSTLLSTGVWHHVAVTFSTTNCTVFIDGRISGSALGDFSIPNDTSGITSIGDWGGQGAIGTYGAIDDFRIYNRSLSTNEVSQLYTIPPLAMTSIGTCPEIYIAGTVGYSYTIQSSTNLTDVNAWVTLTNITLGTSSEIWADTATDITKAANPKKFYRVLPGQ